MIAVEHKNIVRILHPFTSRFRCVYPGGNWKYVNLQNANLEEIKNTGLDLRWANLQGANLDGAAMKNIDILGAGLRRAKSITVEQIKEAKNWEQAIYDNDFCHELGLSSAV